MKPGSALLWLFVINLGVAFGAGIYESRVVVPAWPGTPPGTWPNTGLLFWAFVTTGPLTLLTVGNGIAAWRDRTARRAPWLTAVAITLVERMATFGYFIPSMIGLMGEPSAGPVVDETLARWTMLNNGRHLLTLAAWLAALRALSR